MQLYGVDGMKAVLRVLVSQTVILFVLALIGLTEFWSISRSIDTTYIQTSGLIFFGALCAALLMLGAWSIIVEIAEGAWSIRAEARVRNWLLASIRLSLAASIVGLVLVFAEATGGLSSFAAGRAFSTLALLASVTPPLAASALLAAGAYKHLVSETKTNALLSKSVTDADAALSRINASVRSITGASETAARPHPKGFYVAGLSSKPWYESDEFPWMKNFEAASAEIFAEARQALGEKFDQLEHYHYPGIDTNSWKIFSFVADRKEAPEHLAACPTTAAALRSIPGYPFFRDAMFSILEPGGVIRPHRDHSNLFLTMHFGVRIPRDGFMEVAGMRRPWIEGGSLIFDSSYEHQAVNSSNEARVILLVDFLHPGLTEAERRWIGDAPLWRQ